VEIEKYIYICYIVFALEFLPPFIDYLFRVK